MRTRLLPAHLSALSPLQSLIARRWRPQWICRSCLLHSGQQRALASQSPAAAQSIAEKPYYVTTPIFYVNAAPHVGHMYTMLLADVFKRWESLKGNSALLCTGTDEHGLKIQQAAAKAGLEPRAFCDKGADMFKDLAGQVNLSYDTFIRTSDEEHKAAVEYAWQMLEQRGYIYEGKHEGWYSISDEAYYPAKDVHLIVDPPTGRKIMVSKETGKEVEWTVERNYKFKLSAFRDRLLDWFEQNPEWIVPRSRMEDVINEVTRGLEDLSVSRPTERLSWGVRVPTDSSQTIYVWLDALLNYASAAGYPFTPGSEKAGGWPADLHVIGKDIVRFHCIYWPAFLMALDLPLPKQVLTHAHWTLGRQKMAKSTGNVVNPFFAVERFGTDTMRYFLVRDGGISDDADYENAFIVGRHKKDLQGGLGNLVSRMMRPTGWEVPRVVRQFGNSSLSSAEIATSLPTAEDAERAKHVSIMVDDLQAFPSVVEKHMKGLHPNNALKAIIHQVYWTNAFLHALAPWTLVKKLAASKADSSKSEESLAIQAELDVTIYLALESIRLVGISLLPFMPASATRLLDMIGVKPDRRNWSWALLGKDDEYGDPAVKWEKGEKGSLFPPLTSEH